MKITLTILKEDLEKRNYMSATYCPITKALARAGHPNLRDEGTDITNETGRSVVNGLNEEYSDMRSRVIAMDCGVRDPETFTTTIDVWDESDMRKEAHTNIQDFT